VEKGEVAVEAPFAYAPLDPVSFLDRSVLVFPERVAVVDGEVSWTYEEFGRRTKRLAGMLEDLGVGPGDRVAVLAPNVSIRPTRPVRGPPVTLRLAR